MLTGERLLSSGSWENVNKSLIWNAFIFNQLLRKKKIKTTQRCASILSANNEADNEIIDQGKVGAYVFVVFKLVFNSFNRSSSQSFKHLFYNNSR